MANYEEAQATVNAILMAPAERERERRDLAKAAMVGILSCEGVAYKDRDNSYRPNHFTERAQMAVRYAETLQAELDRTRPNAPELPVICRRCADELKNGRFSP